MIKGVTQVGVACMVALLAACSNDSSGEQPPEGTGGGAADSGGANGDAGMSAVPDELAAYVPELDEAQGLCGFGRFITSGDLDETVQGGFFSSGGLVDALELSSEGGVVVLTESEEGTSDPAFSLEMRWLGPVEDGSVVRTYGMIERGLTDPELLCFEGVLRVRATVEEHQYYVLVADRFGTSLEGESCVGAVTTGLVQGCYTAELCNRALGPCDSQ